METGKNTSATSPLFSQLKELYEYLKSYKITLLISVLICLVAACIFQLYNQPVYRVNSILYVEGVHGNVSDKNPSDKNLNLKSTGILQKAIEESPLMVSYEVSDGAKLKEINRNASPVYVRIKRIDPAFYKKKITIRILDEQSFEIASQGFDKAYAFNKTVHYAHADFTVVRKPNEEYAGEEIQIRFNNPNELTSAYAKKLNINSDAKNKNKLVLSVTDSHPQKGIDFLNTLSRVYASLQPDNAGKREQIISIEDSIRILKKELASLNQKKQAIITKRKTVKPLAVVQNKVTEKQKQTFKVLQSYLDKPVENFVQLPENYTTSDAYLDRQISLYNDLQLRKQKNAGDVLVRADVEKTKANIENRIQSYYKPVQQQASVATEAYVTISPKESGKAKAIRQNKQSQINKLAIERKTIMANTDSPKISVVEKPSYSRIPFVFEATLLYLGAVLLGLVLPMPVIYAKNIMTKTVLSVNDIKKISNVPLIGYFSHHGKETDKANSIADFGRYKYELSVIINQLEKLDMKKAGKVVAISSYISGEGKSYFANHLAVSLAIMDKKVVFVDANLINYRGNDQAGVINFITDKNLTEDDVLVSSPKYPQLFFIGAGTSVKEKVADDLPFYQWEVGKTEHKRMESPRLKKLISLLKKKFDYVILDTPSFNQEPAVEAIYPQADIRLHLVRYNYTRKTYLKNLGPDAEGSQQNTFLVFNDIKHTSPQFYKTLNSTYQA